MKKQEEIIISKQLAVDLIWWLEHASAPCMTIGEVQDRWYQLFDDPKLTLARDAMKYELEKALVAKKGTKQVWLTLEEAKEIAVQLKRNADLFFIQNDDFDFDTEALHWRLFEKIEQTEKENATD